MNDFIDHIVKMLVSCCVNYGNWFHAWLRADKETAEPKKAVSKVVMLEYRIKYTKLRDRTDLIFGSRPQSE